MVTIVRISLLHLNSGLVISILDNCIGHIRNEGVSPPDVIYAHNSCGTYLRVEREICHHGTECCEVTLVVERSKVVEQFERPHERLGRWRIDIVEMHEVLHGYGHQ